MKDESLFEISAPPRAITVLVVSLAISILLIVLFAGSCGIINALQPPAPPSCADCLRHCITALNGLNQDDEAVCKRHCVATTCSTVDGTVTP